MDEMKRALIDEYSRLHATTDYGGSGHKVLPFLLPHVLALKPASIVDYGCGRSNLAELLAARAGIATVAMYDPAVPERATKPAAIADLLINVDVLEHVPDEEIDAVVAEMASMARDALIIVDTRPAKARLSDGRNAHVSQHGEAWWLERLRRFYPTLRPFPARRHGRVGFKTFDAALPAFEEWSIMSRLVVARHARRWARLLTGRGRH
mgnify:CR=1 FL=1